MLSPTEIDELAELTAQELEARLETPELFDDHWCIECEKVRVPYNVGLCDDCMEKVYGGLRKLLRSPLNNK